MSIYDWNHNGKKDFVDDFIEYNIYKESTDQNKKSSYKPSYSGEMSLFSGTIGIDSGLFWQVLLYSSLGIDVDNVSVFVIIILWCVFSGITIFVIEMLRSR